jgi:two-component system cell cycle sensor histidine kinase/response regulator CckA
MIAPAVRSEQVATLYRQSGPVLLANVVNAIVVSAVLWSSASHPFLVGWTIAMAVMTLARILLHRGYWRSRPDADAALAWGRRFVVGSLTAGVLWGMAAAVLFDPGRPAASILITFVIGGMGASAAGTISCYMPAFVAYLIPSVAPLAARMLEVGTPLYLGMGAMVLVYGGAISAVARNTHRALVMAFRLRFENENLVERLSNAQLTLEQSNQTLERRVLERSAELERQGEALRNAQRMEAVGRLAGGIAHDFNNLLTVVLANAGQLLREQGMSAANRAALEDVRGAADRGADLVRQLLAFSRRQRTSPRALDLNRVVRDTERLLARLLGESIALEVTTASGALIVHADAVQLEQVILNLVTNARDAMPAGGKLSLTTALAEVATGHGVLTPGSYVRLSVTDTGTGMDLETLQRAFDPFFTTKGLSRGSGLGLATVHGIVTQSGGHVEVHSQPGQGARFDVFLPRVEGLEAVQPVRPIAVPTEVRPARILLAEDESIVRTAIALSLESQGHEVLTAGDGEEALALLAQAAPVELLITDVVMTRMGGPELARRARQQRPGLRLLFISGYSWENELPTGNPGEEILEKPFTMETLLQRVALLLSRPVPGAEAEAHSTG